MAPRKLSDADKRDVVELYRQLGETTSTIAERYGVSNSTISRILKSMLPEEEYSNLISQKRQGSSTDKDVQESPPPPVQKTSRVERPVLRSQKQPQVQDEAQAVKVPDNQAPAPADTNVESRPALPRRRTRSRALQADDSSMQLPLLSPDDDGQAADADVTVTSEIAFEDVAATDSSLMEDPDYDDLDDDDIDDDDIDDDYEEDEDYDEDDDDEEGVFVAPHLADAVQIVPLTEAALPRTCYLIIDRLSELITRPLGDFADLGQIPSAESNAKTLPIFDNHRVARRFSRRNQRVIKVPNGQLLTKTSAYLQAKGIEHLLIDGNVYSLMGVGDADEHDDN